MSTDTWDVGDVVPIGVNIYDTDVDGMSDAEAATHLANATLVQLTVTRPDGTVFGPTTLNPNPTGVYGYDFPTTMAGRYPWRIVATGTNAGTHSDVFEVWPEDPRPIFSVETARSQLKKTSTADEQLLRLYIAATTEVVEDVCGVIVPKTYTNEKHRTNGGDELFLHHKPIVSIDSVTEYWPAAQVLAEAANPAASGDYYRDDNSGCLTRLVTRTWAENVWVTYRAGYTVIPPSVLKGAMTILDHLWTVEQATVNRGPNAYSDFELAPTPSGFMVPARALELLRPKTRLPGFA